MLDKIARKVQKIRQKTKALRNKKASDARVQQVKSKFYSCGENLQLFGSPNIVAGERIKVGSNCKINEGVYLNGRGNITIGDNVTLSAFCRIISTGYDVDKLMNDWTREHKNVPISIGDNCWICTNACIMPGVSISGKNVIIGAGSVVTHSFSESNVLFAGNPARIVKKHTNDKESIKGE